MSGVDEFLDKVARAIEIAVWVGYAGLGAGAALLTRSATGKHGSPWVWAGVGAAIGLAVLAITLERDKRKRAEAEATQQASAPADPTANQVAPDAYATAGDAEASPELDPMPVAEDDAQTDAAPQAFDEVDAREWAEASAASDSDSAPQPSGLGFAQALAGQP